MSEATKRRIERLHASLPQSIAGHRKDKCDVCFLVNHFDAMKEALERIAKDTILDRQDIEYYKRLHLIHKDWTRGVLKAIESEDL